MYWYWSRYQDKYWYRYQQKYSQQCRYWAHNISKVHALWGLILMNGFNVTKTT